MAFHVAIVGAGPAGFYTAEALLKSDTDYQIDIIDRLPAPYGLIRYGVAPDHQTTKRVTRIYERTLGKDGVTYFGNVDVGSDITLTELRSMYDAVVLSVGAAEDRTVGIPGEDKIGVIGSASFVGWYNAHPDLRDLNPDLNFKAAAIIGNGNVAIDIARVLVKSREEMADSDITEYAMAAIESSPITDVYMFGRRGPVEAKFTNVELREMGHLKNATSLVDPAQLPDDAGDMEEGRARRLVEKNLATLHEFVAAEKKDHPKRVHFSFFASPVEILGGDKVEGLRLEKTRVIDGRAVGSGEFFEIECGLVIPAVGYRSAAVAEVPFDDRSATVINEDGRVEAGLYVAGWIKRGPSGVIGTNKPDGVVVAEHIARDCQESGKTGGAALTAHLAERNIRAVSFSDWKKIDEAEISAASETAPRRKFETVDDLLAAMD
jgi:ferredoxin--NADP+ reductase